MQPSEHRWALTLPHNTHIVPQWWVWMGQPYAPQRQMTWREGGEYLPPSPYSHAHVPCTHEHTQKHTGRAWTRGTGRTAACPPRHRHRDLDSGNPTPACLPPTHRHPPRLGNTCVPATSLHSPAHASRPHVEGGCTWGVGGLVHTAPRKGPEPPSLLAACKHRPLALATYTQCIGRR